MVVCGCPYVVDSPSEYLIQFLVILEVSTAAVASILDLFTESLYLFINSLVVALISIPISVVASGVSSVVT